MVANIFIEDVTSCRPLQLIVLSTLLAVASAVVIPAPAYPAYAHGPAYPAYHGPAVLPAVAKLAVAKVAAPEPYDPNPQYSYSYDVHVSPKLLGISPTVLDLHSLSLA